MPTGSTKGYTLLGDKLWEDGDYNISSVRMEDSEKIRIWRNEQMDGLRQSSPLSVSHQKKYFNDFVLNEFIKKEPAQILLRFCLKGKLIGYGGVVHIDWLHLKGEVSFLMATERARDISQYCEEFAIFLKLLKKLAFNDLGLNKLTTEAYAHRSHHVQTIENANFIREGLLRQHTKVSGKWVDAVVCSLLKSEYFLNEKKTK